MSSSGTPRRVHRPRSKARTDDRNRKINGPQTPLTDARQKLAIWRYDYNNVRPHSSLGNLTPAEARRALEQSDGNAPSALAQPETDDYQQARLSL